MSVIKIAGQNRIFSSLGIEAKLIENLLPLGLEDDELQGGFPFSGKCCAIDFLRSLSFEMCSLICI